MMDGYFEIEDFPEELRAEQARVLLRFLESESKSSIEVLKCLDEMLHLVVVYGISQLESYGNEDILLKIKNLS